MTERLASWSQSSDPLAVNQPTRGAARNESELGDGSNDVCDGLLLPSLGPGITLLDVEGGRGVPVLQSLVLDHLLMTDGPSYWIDARGFARTTTLSRISPSQRLLNRINVARGFTVYQHYGAVCDLPNAVKRYVQDSAEKPGDGFHRLQEDLDTTLTPSLVVAPAFDAFYRDNDTLSIQQSETLQARALARLSAYAEGFDTPVLVTRLKLNEFTSTIERIADHHLTCELTQMGPRFTGDDFETLVYPVEDGFYQTTFAYWKQILSTRAAQVGLQHENHPSPGISTRNVGHGTMIDGSSEALTANPLSDALTANQGW